MKIRDTNIYVFQSNIFIIISTATITIKRKLNVTDDFSSFVNVTFYKSRIQRRFQRGQGDRGPQ